MRPREPTPRSRSRTAPSPERPTVEACDAIVYNLAIAVKRNLDLAAEVTDDNIIKITGVMYIHKEKAFVVNAPVQIIDYILILSLKGRSLEIAGKDAVYALSPKCDRHQAQAHRQVKGRPHRDRGRGRSIAEDRPPKPFP